MPVKLRLQEVAQAKGVTLSQVQRKTGLTMMMVRRYWYNQTASVQLPALEALADLLQVAPGELLMKTEKEEM